MHFFAKFKVISRSIYWNYNLQILANIPPPHFGKWNIYRAWQFRSWIWHSCLSQVIKTLRFHFSYPNTCRAKFSNVDISVSILRSSGVREKLSPSTVFKILVCVFFCILLTTKLRWNQKSLQKILRFPKVKNFNPKAKIWF